VVRPFKRRFRKAQQKILARGTFRIRRLCESNRAGDDNGRER
jgi:hypothetical protein